MRYFDKFMFQNMERRDRCAGAIDLWIEVWPPTLFALWFCLCIISCISGCRSSRPTPEREASRLTPAVVPLTAADSTPSLNGEGVAQAGAESGLFSRVIAAIKPETQKKGGAQKSKTKYKNVTIQQVIGDGNKVASGDTKLKGSQQATDSATLTTSQTGNAANISGDGNQLEQKAETQQAPDWKATLAKALAGPLGIVIGAAALGGLVYLVILWRRKRAAQNIA